ncbi:hypothetical protein REPUB_Repub15cG0002000 [Reevesia pubescens]
MASSMSLSFSSSLLSSPLPRSEKSNTKPHPSLSKSFFIPCAVAAAVPSSVSDKKRQRHWKEGEYPGLSQHFIPGSSKKTPLKNLKKKLDRKNNAKAWVCTVTETLSDCILKKQWLQALQNEWLITATLRFYVTEIF